MEIIIVAVIGVIGYVIYSFLKGSVFKKSLVATEIQRLFDVIEHLSIGQFNGDRQLAAQEYVEKYWPEVKGLAKGKVRTPAITAFVLLHTVKDLHNTQDQNTDFVLQALGRELGEMQASVSNLSENEATMLSFATKNFLTIVKARDQADFAGLQG